MLNNLTSKISIRQINAAWIRNHSFWKGTTMGLNIFPTLSHFSHRIMREPEIIHLYPKASLRTAEPCAL